MSERESVDVERGRALAAAATTGRAGGSLLPWRVHLDSMHYAHVYNSAGYDALGKDAAEFIVWLANNSAALLDAVEEAERLRGQIDALAAFIMDEVDGEPCQSEGAVDTAVRLLREREVSVQMAQAAEAEVSRLREALRKLQARKERANDSYRSGVEYPNDYSRGWHDGHTTAMATCWLDAEAALDPEGWAEHEEQWKVSSYGTDREWFELTGNCGHCGLIAEDCACTDDDPCQCGPHPERRTWPRDCFNCKGTGKIEPTRRAALAPVGDPNG